jgi:acyl-CoA thioester hydrolase
MTDGNFTYWFDQGVDLRDLDGFGHVNNAVYLTYLENARVAYFMDVLGVTGISEIRNVMASVTVNFRSQIDFPGSLRTGVRVDSIGNSSFVLAYEIRDADDRVVADATSTQVMFDFEAGKTFEVPEEWRGRMADGEDKR